MIPRIRCPYQRPEVRGGLATKVAVTGGRSEKPRLPWFRMAQFVCRPIHLLGTLVGSTVGTVLLDQGPSRIGSLCLIPSHLFIMPSFHKYWNKHGFALHLPDNHRLREVLREQGRQLVTYLPSPRSRSPSSKARAAHLPSGNVLGYRTGGI